MDQVTRFPIYVEIQIAGKLHVNQASDVPMKPMPPVTKTFNPRLFDAMLSGQRQCCVADLLSSVTSQLDALDNVVLLLVAYETVGRATTD